MKKIRILQNTGLIVLDSNKRYDYMPKDVFIKMFLPQDCSYCIVPFMEPADICFFGVRLDSEKFLRPNETNILIGLENCIYWMNNIPKNWDEILGNIYKPVVKGEEKKYNHFNAKQNSILKKGWKTRYNFIKKYGHMGSNKTNILFHNDISSPIGHPKKVIPTIHCRIRYYNIMKQYYLDNIVETPFHKKKFILFISKNNYNENKILLMNNLKKNGIEYDHIADFDSVLKNTNCYNSIELFNLFNKYKFIAAFENSKTNGYITEKIFNVFFSKSIPVYDGAPNVSSYLNPGCFIQMGNNFMNNLWNISINEILYSKILNADKIQPKFQNIKIEY